MGTTMKTIKAEFNKVFKPVHRSRKRYIVMKGSAGSGKSVDTAQMYILRLMSDKGRNLLCVRKSDVTNRDSTFAELQKAVYVLGVGTAWKINQSPLSLTCLNGNKIIFRGMNDDKQREKIKSISFNRGALTDVWIEEATELSQADFEIIDDRLRGELPEGLFYQIKLTFNPVSSSHWIKRVFFDFRDENTLTHHSTYLDNRFCDAAYQARMERRKATDPEGYQIYGLGEWGETGGLILSNYIIEDFPQDADRFDEIAIGHDFGFNHADALLVLGWKDDEIYIMREIYEFEKDMNEIIDRMQREEIPQRVTMWCDSAEPDRIRQLQKSGYKARGVVKGSGSVNAQIDWLKGHKIHVHCSCVNTIKEMQQWRWRMDEHSGQYTDEPVNVFDDAMAALRYGCESWRKDMRAKVIDRRSFFGV